MIKPEEFVSDIFEMMARMIDEAVLAERDACAQVVNDDRGLSDDDAIRVMKVIRARGQACLTKKQ